MKPRNAVSHHAEIRAQQRWGSDVSVEQIERQLLAGEAQVYEYENSTIWKIVVRIGGEQIPVVYNRRRKVVITVLPKGELDRIRAEYGFGLTQDERREFFSSMSPERKRAHDLWKAEQESRDPNFNAGLARRARERMERVDSLPEDVRAVVYEYNLEIVWEFWSHGVRSGNDIAILIEAARKATSAGSASLLPLYRHFGVPDEGKVQYLATAARLEPAPRNQKQNRFRLNSNPNRQRSAAA